jgi:hypothetical protein
MKTIAPSTYAVENIEGVAAYNSLCQAAQLKCRARQTWASCPRASSCTSRDVGRTPTGSGSLRRASSRAETYDTMSEAYTCVNLMIISPGELPSGGPALETEEAYGAKCLIQPYLGMLPMRSCSDFMFVPGTSDCHIFMLHTEESHDGQGVVLGNLVPRYLAVTQQQSPTSSN